VGFAVHSVKSFGDVENDVWFCSPQPLGKIFVGLEADDFSQVGESCFHGGDRNRAVPLGELVARSQRREAWINFFTWRLFIGTRKLPVFLTAARGDRAGEL
jgi:hypothetical protein